MICPQCGSANSEGSTACASCDSDLLASDRTVERRLDGDRQRTGAAVATPPPKSFADWTRDRRRASGELAPGIDIGNRYRVIRTLGHGGMGMVYLVHDNDLGRDVALKLILPELGDSPAILERFRREILLSSRVTHPNVLRVFDLGESDEVKFLTMEYVDGEDLASAIGHGRRLPVEKVVSIFRQICQGLAAAHGIGVVHRDLKPQNIMIDRSGKVFLTDFGLARTAAQTNLTVSGAVVGTPHYMSPEQVKGTEIDQRSDIYSLGVILYEMLAGDVPFKGNSAYEIMIKRVQQPPRPIEELNRDTPAYLAKILNRCLAVDPDERYQTLEQVIADLDRAGARVALQPSPRPFALAAVAAGLLLFSVAGVLMWRARGPAAPVVAQKPVSVLISDFRNGTGEPVFDGTLEPLMGVALEGASFITSYDRGQARKVAVQLQKGATGLAEPLARLVAAREGINVVISGAIERAGSDYKVSARATDGITGKPIASEEVVATDKADVLTAASRIAAEMRSALGDTTPESVRLAAGETFSAGSVEAAHAYAQAQTLQWAGKYEDAIEKYTDAIRLDPNLGRAYAGRAAMVANLGQRQQAEADYKLAMARIDRMTDREKFRTRGGYFLLVRNTPSAIDEFSALVRQYPADTAGINNLALAYFYTRDMARAMEEGRKPVAIYPKNVLYRNNLALYAMYAGDFKTAAEQASTVLQLNPNYVKGYVALALSQLAQNQLAAATATYQKLQKVSARGSSFAANGLADVALVEGRDGDAASLLRAGIDEDRKNKNNDAAAYKLATLAEAEMAGGRKAEALSASGSAVSIGNEESAIFPAARAFIAAGDADKASALAATLASKLESDPQLYAKLIEGEIELERGNARGALTRFGESQKLGDSWLGRFDLGRAYLDLGAYTEASSEFDRCLKRRGEATAVFLDDIPSYHYFAPVYYYLGRAQEGLGNASAAESYQTYLSLRSKAESDPLAADARRRLAAMKR
ncbi:MAG TPA: protein kinase [Thermoanaerobaculia bacterium]